MIVLFTDFGWHGPYVGQMKAVIHQNAPGVDIVDLLHDVPTFDILAGSYLLDALYREFPKDSVFLSIVDPGVGNPERLPCIVKVDGYTFVGPDNGLFSVVAKRAKEVEWWDIGWKPEHLSSSFHGRDLFAPVAAALARGEMPASKERDPATRIDPELLEDLYNIIYIDHYGNCMTGIHADSLSDEHEIQIGKVSVQKAITFSSVPKGRAFWYKNSCGLVEVAINKNSAKNTLGVNVGDKIGVA